MVNVLNLNVKKFITLTDVSYTFPKTGIVMVQGKNNNTGGSNGAGKSILFESICWALYGKTLRGSSVKEGEVELTLQNEQGDLIKIKREGSSLFLFINDEEIVGNKTEKQDIIIKDIVGVSWKVFSLLTFFNPFTISNWFVSFSDTDRKEIFAEVIKLEFFDIAWNKIKNMIKELNNTINSEQGQILLMKSQLDQMSSYISTYKTLSLEVDNAIRSFKSSLNNHGLNEVIEGLSFEKTTLLPDLNESLTRLNDIVNRVGQNIGALEYEKQMLLKEEVELKKPLTIKDSVCPLCKQPISDSHRKHLELEINKQIEELRKKQAEILEKQHILNETKNNLNELINSVRFIINKATELNKLEGYNSQGQNIEQNLKEIQAQIEEDKEILEILKKWEKAFAPKGIRNSILTSVISTIADYMFYYSSLLDLPVKSEIDSKTGRISYSLDYKSLSSGEKRRLEVSLLFALREVLEPPLNILVIDEVFDHLDKVGLEKVNPFIQNFSMRKQIPIFIVTHRSSLPIIENQVLLIERTKDVSHLFILESNSEEIFVEPEEEAPMSFEEICEVLIPSLKKIRGVKNVEPKKKRKVGKFLEITISKKSNIDRISEKISELTDMYNVNTSIVREGG